MASHIVSKYSLGAGKPFFPGGARVEIRYFQNQYREMKPKINVSLDILQRFGLSSLLHLGKDLLADVKHPATYLYDNAILPRFYADALNTIAHKARDLQPGLAQVQLRNLRRDNVAKALAAGTVSAKELGKYYEGFARLPIQRRLEILEELSVLELRPGALLPAKPVPVPEAKPPIRTVDPRELKPKIEKIEKKGQLDLFAPKKD